LRQLLCGGDGTPKRQRHYQYDGELSLKHSGLFSIRRNDLRP
jgi:hypothetical protein